LEVNWDGKPVRGAPYTIVVEENGGAERIIVDKDTLKYGIIGHPLQTTIDTRLATKGNNTTIPIHTCTYAGELSCECVGPSGLCQSTLYADDTDGTYRLVMKPMEVGRHTLTILYNGENVEGCSLLTR
jgi:hypothetical protein